MLYFQHSFRKNSIGAGIMLEQLYQTITSFLFDLPAIASLFTGVKEGNVDIFGGLLSLLGGLFGKNTSAE